MQIFLWETQEPTTDILLTSSLGYDMNTTKLEYKAQFSIKKSSTCLELESSFQERFRPWAKTARDSRGDSRLWLYTADWIKVLHCRNRNCGPFLYHVTLTLTNNHTWTWLVSTGDTLDNCHVKAINSYHITNTQTGRTKHDGTITTRMRVIPTVFVYLYQHLVVTEVLTPLAVRVWIQRLQHTDRHTDILTH